jgi:hypothetical protein
VGQVRKDVGQVRKDVGQVRKESMGLESTGLDNCHLLGKESHAIRRVT